MKYEGRKAGPLLANDMSQQNIIIAATLSSATIPNETL